jgi:hypothetical protein
MKVPALNSKRWENSIQQRRLLLEFLWVWAVTPFSVTNRQHRVDPVACFLTDWVDPKLFWQLFGVLGEKAGGEFIVAQVLVSG